MRKGILLHRATLSLCLFSSFAAHAETTSYTYTPEGRIASVDGPRMDVRDVTYFAYDASGNLTSITNALGQVVVLSNHDSSGNPQTVVDPNGTVTTLSYTSEGWLASRTVEGVTSRLSYNLAGDVTEITAGDGSFLRYSYDNARRLVGISNALGESQQFTLDAMGNRTAVKLKDGSGKFTYQLKRTYDELGRLLTQVGAAGQTTRFGYDRIDQLIGQTDPLGHSTQQAFDGVGRVIRITDPLKGQVDLSYNGQDQITQVVDPRGVTTKYTYDRAGRQTSVISPDGGTALFLYDDAGNVIEKTDPRGVVTHYQYDELNRVVSQHYPDNPALDVTYIYDETADGNKGVGRLTRRVDPSGTTIYKYDARGHLVAQDKVQQLETLKLQSAEAFVYDKADRLVSHTYPDDIRVNYTRDNAGQITAVGFTLKDQTFPIASEIAHLPFGPVNNVVWNSGAKLRRVFNADYRLIRQSIGEWRFEYGFDAAGNLTRHQSNIWDLVNYQYDPLNRLIRESDGLEQTEYSFDASGNRLKRRTSNLVSGAVTDLQSATVESGSNRLVTLNDQAVAYDPAGNLQQHASGLRYSYDASGRMDAVYQADGQRTAQFAYNALGQRTLKWVYDPQSGDLQTRSVFFHGPKGELIGQTDYSGADAQRLKSRYWIWLDRMPLAQVELSYDQGAFSGVRVIYLYPDHLDTPRLASHNLTTVWAWPGDAFGAAAPDEDVDKDGVLTQIPLRFAGQYYDSDTLLNYNYFRDYDPQTGRYVESDPIGLRGGLNTYGYAMGNPIAFMDPYGLSTDIWDVPISKWIPEIVIPGISSRAVAIGSGLGCMLYSPSLGNGECPAGGCYYAIDKTGKPKAKASNSEPGDTIRTPTTHPDDFVGMGGGNRKNVYTGENWSSSDTNHSGSEGGEWKVGPKPGVLPRPGNKITVSAGGKIIKIDK